MLPNLILDVGPGLGDNGISAAFLEDITRDIDVQIDDVGLDGLRQRLKQLPLCTYCASEGGQGLWCECKVPREVFITFALGKSIVANLSAPITTSPCVYIYAGAGQRKLT